MHETRRGKGNVLCGPVPRAFDGLREVHGWSPAD